MSESTPGLGDLINNPNNDRVVHEVRGVIYEPDNKTPETRVESILVDQDGGEGGLREIPAKEVKP